VFVDGQNSVGIVREKIFVPELAIIPYEHEDESVRIAHDTRETSSTRRVSKRIRSGKVPMDGARPDRGSRFGVHKQSGNGRQ
jgi:aldehyde dehydrogenase (NAD+)